MPDTMKGREYVLPSGWTWKMIHEAREKWNISDNMVPVAVVPGLCVAWGTLASVGVRK